MSTMSDVRAILKSEEMVAPAVEMLISLVVPTRNEAPNIQALLERLGTVAQVIGEVIFVDDSDDDTPSVVEGQMGRHPFPVRLVHRAAGERASGLSGAVVEGFREASHPLVGVMDADLQHPPEVLASLHDVAVAQGLDLVYGTRYVPGGDEHALGRMRVAVSHQSTRLARMVFPKRLTSLSDPMSGLFLFRRSIVDVAKLRPVGYKILLEVVLRTPGLRMAGVPYVFGERHAGDSKASFAEGMKFLRHLVRLRMETGAAGWHRAIAAGRFGLVGLSGLVVNQAMLAGFVELGGIGYALASILATQGSTTWNFALTDLWVFRKERTGSALRRFGLFAAMNNAALLLRVPLLVWLVTSLGLHYLTANLVTLVLLFVLRFALSDRLIWRHNAPVRTSTNLGAVPMTQTEAPPVITPQADPRQGRYAYDVAGIVTIRSQVRLPELEFFRQETLESDADIVIRRGRVGSRRPRSRRSVELAAGTVLYQEQLGSWGCDFSVDMSGPIVVTVGHLLAASPHVLYTNVIEALFRFLLVSRGHMLLHSATFELDGKGVMMSARTDTGKTGTILRLMREREGRFLSDDMTIVHPDGTATSYPKPLTISSHTVRALDGSTLSRWEWFKLGIQSRIHSKGGRSFAQRLAKFNIPIMAVNALAQIVVPPPKYTIDRLVPCPVGGSTSVSHMFIIERGAPAIDDIAADALLDELLENTDDAYGFPPFEDFAPAIAINGDGYLTLREQERAILAKAMSGVTAMRVASDDFTWADTIPRLLAGYKPIVEPTELHPAESVSLQGADLRLIGGDR